MERWVVGSTIQQNGGSTVGKVFFEAEGGGRVSFLSEVFWMAREEGGVRLLTSIFRSKIGGCLVCLKAKIMILEQWEHYTVNVTARFFEWEMKRRFGSDSDCWVWNKWDCWPTGAGAEASLHQYKLQNGIFEHVDGLRMIRMWLIECLMQDWNYISSTGGVRCVKDVFYFPPCWCWTWRRL